MGQEAIDALFEVAKAMQSENWESLTTEAVDRWGQVAGTHGFNKSLMVCIPKKPLEVDEALGEIYSPETTQPLMLVDVDNRIVASSFRARWGKAINDFVSEDQKGLLPGRSMIAKIVDMETDGIKASSQNGLCAIILLDFKAAFPSVAHEFIKKVMKGWGPPHARLTSSKRCRANATLHREAASMMDLQWNLASGKAVRCRRWFSS